MKNPTLLIVILVVLLILSLGVVVYLLVDQRETKQQHEAVIKEKEATIAYHETAEGRERAEKASVILTFSHAQESYGRELAEIKKKMELTNRDIKGINSFLQTGFSVRDSGTSVLHTIYYPTKTGDSTQVKALDVKDWYLDFHADIVKDLASWHYNYKDTLTAVGRTSRKWFLGKESYFVDAMLRNPKARITGLKSFRVEEFKDKRISLGPAVVYDPFNNQFRIGFSLQYALVKF